MRDNTFFVGFEVGTGKEIYVSPSHMVVTGITRAGKTTCIESIVHESHMKAVLFKTKIGEKAVSAGHKIQPFFREKHDWSYVQSLLEATLKEKLKFERAWIIEVCKRTSSLLDVKHNIDAKLEDKRVRGVSRNVYLTLQAYFEMILPQIHDAKFTKELNLSEGINIMDLEGFSSEIQSLVIRSVLEEVLYKHTDIACVIPECLKGDTLVVMDDGRIKKIKDIKSGQEIVGGVVSNRFTKQEKRMLHFSGSFELKTSLTHPCLIVRYNTLRKGKHTYRDVGSVIPESEVELVLARDVKIGDYFLVPEKIPHKTRYHWTPEQLGFIALILTDGNIKRGDTNGLVRVSVSKDVEWFRKKFIEGLEAFGFEDTFKESKNKRGNTVFWSTSKELVDILWSFGCFGGKKANNIDIVNQIFLSPLESIKKFINICFCCDGSVSKKGYPRFTVTSEVFIKKLQYLLLKFGIFSNIRKQKRKQAKHSDIWELVILRDSVKRFKEIISLDMERKRDKIRDMIRKERYAEYKGHRYILRKIRNIKEEDTFDNFYDFTTTDHYFIANTILTHNCWKFTPERRGNPVKPMAEEFIRQGATNNNFLIIDSQDMAGIAKSILKQVSTWVLGNQREINEVKHTLSQIPLPTKAKPKPEDIQTLKTGHFYVCTPDFTTEIYSKPTWMDYEVAKGIALGHPLPTSQDVTNTPKNPVETPLIEIPNIVDEIMFNVDYKIQALKKEIIQEIGKEACIVSPLEKIKKDFLQEIRDRILMDVASLSEDQKKILLFIETRGKGSNITEILDRVFGISTTSQSNRKRVLDNCRVLKFLNLVRIDSNNRIYPHLKERIIDRMQVFDATTDEINLLYNHILSYMLT